MGIIKTEEDMAAYSADSVWLVVGGLSVTGSAGKYNICVCYATNGYNSHSQTLSRPTSVQQNDNESNGSPRE